MSKYGHLIRQLRLLIRADEDIVHAISNNGITYDVGSSHPGGEEAPKGWAVRPLKRHASWVQTVVRQVGLLSTMVAET